MRPARAAARNSSPQPFSSAMLCGQASKARFPKGCAAMACAARAIARYRGQAKTQLQAKAIAAAINEGEHPSDAATHGSWPPASAQASFVAFCTVAITLGSMMSRHNFPAESFIHQ